MRAITICDKFGRTILPFESLFEKKYQGESLIKKRRILQPDDWSCLACCAAMATNEDLEDVIKCLKLMGIEPSEGSYSFPEIVPYLISRGYMIGSLGAPEELTLANKDPETYLLLPFLSDPAIVNLGLRRSTEPSHAVYWSGEEVLDPDPRSAARH
jgi:hypothetical protein